MLNFEQYLNEKSIRDQAREDFGQFLFGEFWSKIKRYSTRPEKDTELEKKIFDTLISHLKGDKPPSSKLKTFAKILDKYKEVWPDILVPNSKIVFRGKAITLNDLIDLVDKNSWKRYGSEDVYTNYTYKASNSIQSWTTKLWTARTFSRMSDIIGPGEPFAREKFKSIRGTFDTTGTMVPIVLETKTQGKDMIFSSNFLDKVAEVKLGFSEREIIRFSNRPIKCKIIIEEYFYNMIKEIFLDKKE